MKNKRIYANLALVFVTIIWGASFIVVKSALDYMDPIYMTFLRFAIAALLMALIFRRRLMAMKLADLRAGGIIGSFMFLAFISQTIGLQYTTPGKQAFIIASNVAFVPFIYWLTSGRRPDGFDILAALMCVLGVGLLSLKRGMGIGRGDLLTIVSTIFFSCHIVAVGKYSRTSDPIVLSILQFATVALISLIACLILRVEIKPLDIRGIKSIAYTAVISTGLTFAIQNVAQKYTEPNQAALILSLEAVFGAFFAILVGQDSFSLKFLLGSLIIFLAIIVAESKLNFIRRRRQS